MLTAAALATVGLLATTLGSTPLTSPESAAVEPAESKTLIVGGGCFWCVEAVYEDLIGVLDVESGYAGGSTVNPTYEQVCSGRTGHAEVVKITYDPGKVSRDDLLRIFFTVHDPTTLNRQGPDSGTQYRSVIFFRSEEEKSAAQRIIGEITKAKLYRAPIVTTLEPLTVYYVAEAYHQDYFEKFEKASPLERMKFNSGYCSAIVAPKVAKFRKQYADKLRKKG